MTSLIRIAAAIALTTLAACASDAPNGVAPIGDSDAPVTARAISGMDGVTRQFEVLERQVDSDGLVVAFEVDDRPLTVRIGEGDPRYVEVFDEGGMLLSVEQGTDGATRAFDGVGQQFFGTGGIPQCWLTDSVDGDVVAAVEEAALAFLGDTSGAGQSGMREARAEDFVPTVVLGCPGIECEGVGTESGAKCCCSVGERCSYGTKNFGRDGWCNCSDAHE